MICTFENLFSGSGCTLQQRQRLFTLDRQRLYQFTLDGWAQDKPGQKFGILVLCIVSLFIIASNDLVEAVVWVITETLLGLLTCYNNRLAEADWICRTCINSPARLAFSLSNSSMPRVSASRSMKAPVNPALYN